MLCPHHHYQQAEVKHENKQKQIGTVVDSMGSMLVV